MMKMYVCLRIKGYRKAPPCTSVRCGSALRCGSASALSGVAVRVLSQVWQCSQMRQCKCTQVRQCKCSQVWHCKCS